MKPYDTMCQIRHQQVFHAATNNVDAGQLVVGAGGSARAVPDDPLGCVLQRFRTENGFAVDTGGCGCAWFRDFRDEDVDMSTYNAVDFLEMLLDLPDAAVSGAEATEAPAPARAEAVVVPDRPIVMSRSPLSSSSDSSSSSSSDDDDDPWLPAKSNKCGGTKSRRQQQQRPPARQMKQQPVSTARQAPSSVAVAVEGGVGSGNERWCRHCGTTETTLWRVGPEGPKTLCNACRLRHKNKSAAPTTKRRPAAKPSCAKSKNYSVMPLVGDEKVVRKKRSMVICID